MKQITDVFDKKQKKQIAKEAQKTDVEIPENNFTGKTQENNLQKNSIPFATAKPGEEVSPKSKQIIKA